MPAKGYIKNKPSIRHYVYEHYRLDTNQVFYVGIGTQDPRTFNFGRAHTTHGRNTLWTNIYKKAGRRVEIVYLSDDYEKTKTTEIELIAKYGRRCDGGLLANFTDGGDGVRRIVSEETRSKLSISIRKSNSEHPERGRKIREAHIIPVIQFTKQGGSIEWPSIIDAARALSLDAGSITKVCKGQRETCGKSKWIYKNDMLCPHLEVS